LEPNGALLDVDAYLDMGQIITNVSNWKCDDC
jgi:hypothetical protein